IGLNGVANFSVSQNGMLVFRSTGSTLNRLVWIDRNGRELSEVAPASDFRAPALSPDGSRIAIRRRDTDGSNIDVWIIDPARGTSTRFTFDPGDDGNPVWSPDGSKIAWSALRGNANGIWVKDATGSGPEEEVSAAGPNAVALCWSRDGRYLFYQTFGQSLTDVSVIDMQGDHKPKVVLGSGFNERRARISPDGHWLAYESDESGRAEVYVIPFPAASGKWQISTRGGIEPCWSNDGKE